MKHSREDGRYFLRLTDVHRTGWAPWTQRKYVVGITLNVTTLFWTPPPPPDVCSDIILILPYSLPMPMALHQTQFFCDFVDFTGISGKHINSFRFFAPALKLYRLNSSIWILYFDKWKYAKAINHSSTSLTTAWNRPTDRLVNTPISGFEANLLIIKAGTWAKAKFCDVIFIDIHIYISGYLAIPYKNLELEG